MQTIEKEDFPLGDIRRYLEPGPIVLVSSAWQGKANIMAMGWHMMLGFSPALFACYIWDGNHSFEALRKSRQSVINLPTPDLVDEVVGIGNCSGDAVDKFDGPAENPPSRSPHETFLVALRPHGFMRDCLRRREHEFGQSGPGTSRPQPDERI